MSGLRTLGSWTMGPIRQMERASLRLLGTTKSSVIRSSIHCEVIADRHQRNLFVGKPEIIPHRFYSRSVPESGFGRKGKNFWSAIAAGLLGLGGVTLAYNNADDDEGLFKSITAYCDCGCDKNGAGGGGGKKDDCIEKKCDTSECLRKSDCEEQIITKANCDLERALKDTKGKAVEYTEAALKAYCDAILAINEFMNKVYCAVEEENLDSPRFDEVWADVYNSLKKRCTLAKDAMEKGACAWELLKRLREVIENGKACKYTSCNPLLVTAEETLICAEKEICAKKQEMEQILKESRPVEQYRNLIEEFRRDLKAEADSLVPSDLCRVTLNDNEANMVLTHAYKKILRIQKEMSEGEGGGEC